MATVYLLPAAWLFQYLFPRMRVSNEGIARRWLWSWDLWSWDEFADGRIGRAFYKGSYSSERRPWWRKNVHLSVLEDVDAERIDSLIRRIWVAPPPPEVPEQVSIRLGWPGSRTLTFTPETLISRRRRSVTEVSWSDVVEVEIWRLEADRQDFRTLRIRTLTFEALLRRHTHQGQIIQNWSGATSEPISAAVAQFVPPQKVRDFSIQGPPRNLEELNARIERVIKPHREALILCRWTPWVGWALALTPLIACPWPSSVFSAAVFSLQSITIHAMAVSQRKRIEQSQQELAQQRIEVEGPDSQTNDGPTIESRAPAA